MPKLPHNIELRDVKKDELPAKIASSLSKGITEKRILSDQSGAYYLIKKPDTLTVNDVFQGYLSHEELNNPSFNTMEHIFSIKLEGAFLEILIPHMAKKMFEGILVVPENHLHIDKDGAIGVISKFINGFSEFLSQKEAVKTDPLFEREYLPKRTNLSLTIEEAKILGQLYAVALVFNLWDLLNSKLLNSGYCVESDGTKRAAIVDFGCAGILSYKGRHADTLALDDPSFSPKTKISYSFFGQNYRDHYRHGYALPFDKLVGPLLPHTIISDLFNMSGEDIISRSMLDGFCQAITAAEKNMAQNPHLLEEALMRSYDAFTLDSSLQANELKTHLNAEFYGQPEKNSHNLVTLLQQRLTSTQMLIAQFKAGIPATAIHEEIRDCYYYSQC
ncbi:hypothetical protein [Fluoribacter gormanii]|uniref:Uncharacterized protein n=1 Tax=Fluoribacter gormanii TaxID=464 RepID=A0A377GLC6_9GAMM|nr:hypothetical protein [Fluoribacter gormanii]KTD01815.1 hypothetical protein Lgor_2192 [Fluoribacter gormanii]MCW8442984.1 hypothetical protein [Fluoribacter gormanii]SIR21642.1 hypothetical protein SAMN05421777_10860 [Fluoribacter gormanii]STO25414.1 Uncharacterised protein [Fluoribacter gormanii]